MTSHFLDEVFVEKFKCHSQLTVNGFKHINVFSGKNNVGKTAFLEFLNENNQHKNTGFIRDSFFEFEFKKSTIRTANPRTEFVDNLLEVQEKLEKDNIFSEVKNIINSFDLTSPEWKLDYNSSTPTLYQDNQIIEITSKGFLHIVHVIFALYACKDGYLCIDDVANIVHHSQLEKFWKLIFNLAIKNNVQIFCTTINLEIIKIFAEISKNYPNKSAYFEICRNQHFGVIKVIKHEQNTLNFELDRNIDIRG